MLTILSLALAGAGAVGGSECRVLLIARAAHEQVMQADTGAAPCRSVAGRKQDNPPLMFDGKQRVARARVALAAGQYLGRAFFPAAPVVRSGDHMVLRQHVGRVAIERDVVVMQDGFAGGRVFVRDDDGVIFAAPVAGPVASPEGRP